MLTPFLDGPLKGRRKSAQTGMRESNHFTLSSHIAIGVYAKRWAEALAEHYLHPNLDHHALDEPVHDELWVLDMEAIAHVDELRDAVEQAAQDNEL